MRLTFQNAGLWPFLLAVLVPIVLHLLSRRTPQVRTLPTLRFLQKAMANQSRLYRLRDKLLLLVRFLFVLLLVLAFLRPTFTTPLARTNGTARTVVLVLDVSLSMGQTSGGVTVLARAQGMALRLLDDLRTGDTANVVLAAGTPKLVLSKPGSDFGTLRQAVKAATVTAEKGEMNSALAVAAEQLAQAAATEKTLLLASDFQRTNWESLARNTLPAGTQTVLLDAGTAERTNAALISLRLNPPSPRPGETAQIVAEVANYAPALRLLNVSLKTEGISAPAPQSVNVPPFGTAAVSFPVVFPRTGQFRITARIPADNLPADDTRFLVADLTQSRTVLLLTDAPPETNSGAYFLMAALNPTPQSPGGVRVVSKRPALLTETDLKSSDGVLWTATQTFPRDKLALLARYLGSGGNLTVFLSGSTMMSQMEALNRTAKSGEGLPFLPVVPLDLRGKGKRAVALREIRTESPLLKLFQGSETALREVRFTRIFLTNNPVPNAEILLKFDDGTVAAAANAYGSGKVLVCNFSPAPADSDLAKQPVFPPLVHEIVKAMTGTGLVRRDVFPGTSAAVPLDKKRGQGEITVQGPDGGKNVVPSDLESGGVVVERLPKPGFYTLFANGSPLTVFAVNPDPAESDLRPLPESDLRTRFDTTRTLAVGGRQGNIGATLDALQNGRPLWPLLLVCACLLLLLEQSLTFLSARVKNRE